MDSYMDPGLMEPCAPTFLQTYLSSGCPLKASEFSYWKSWPSLGVGVGCRATAAAFPSTFMESTTVGRPKAAPLLWRRPKAASIYVDGKAAVVALQPTPTPKEGQDFQ